MPETALDALSGLLDLSPGSIDQTHDTLRLIGVVLGQVALIEIVANPVASPRERVTAAKALMDIGESPEHVAERLRSSPFSGLTIEQLRQLASKLQSKEAKDLDIGRLIASVRDETTEENPPTTTFAGKT